MSRPIADIVRAINGISRKWMDIISNPGMMKELQDILNSVILEPFSPAYDDIFNFARFSFDNTKVVILGMDPYPTPGDAHGLSFSTKSTSCPASLGRVYSLLMKARLIDSRPASFDLSYLAAQGFIMLNTALTVRSQAPGSHIRMWSSWSDQLIKNISNEAPDGTIWCLWGSDAQKKEHLIDSKRHTVLKAPHPVASTKPNFLDCDHFQQIAERYPNIVWDPTKTDTDLFTDCSARGNQFNSCRASWGVVCTRGLLKDKTWAGEVPTVEIDYRGKKEIARPTNIRAECLALINAMNIAKRLPVSRVRIFSDSHFWIRDMYGKYIPDWVERQSSWNSHKNSDLTQAFWELATSLSGKIEFHFVNAWHDRVQPADGTDDLYWWIGNRAAERAAEHALGLC